MIRKNRLNVPVWMDLTLDLIIQGPNGINQIGLVLGNETPIRI